MSDSHKHYDYFKVEGTAVKALIDAFADIGKGRDAAIKAANVKLEAFPVWQSYIIDHYKIMKTGFGEATGRGIPMLTTYGGRHPLQDDCLIFAVPNTKDKEGHAKHGDVEIPDEFVQLTYGQFYDIANSKAA